MVFGLGVIIAWLWMARASGQGRNWARILSTVLFGLATLELIGVGPQHPGSYPAHFVIAGRAYSVIHSVVGATVLGVIVPVLLWLTGLAAVWLLWHPASTTFFRPARPAPSTWLKRPGFVGGYDAGALHFHVFTSADIAALGGSPQADALATEQFWTRMITFLNHLAARQSTPS